MTAHVAEAGEARGRVVLRFSAGMPNQVAIDAAVHVARAFDAEVENLYVEDVQAVDFAGFSFAREIPLRGGTARQVSPHAVHSDFRSAFSHARRTVADATRRAHVPVSETFVQDDPVQALVSACARTGPWNLVAFAEPFSPLTGTGVEAVFERDLDATGAVVVGPKARTQDGPVVVAIDDAQHAEAMLRAAERIAGSNESEVVILLVAENRTGLRRLDAGVREMLADRDDIRIGLAEVTFGQTAIVAEAVRRIGGRFLVVQYGGMAAPKGNGQRALTMALECPVLLVR